MSWRGVRGLLPLAVMLLLIAHAPAKCFAQAGERESPSVENGEASALVETEEHAPSVAPFVMMGTGAIVSGVGLGVLVAGLADRASVEGAAPGTRFEDVAAAADRAPTMIGVGQLLGYAGLVFLGGGLTWWLLEVLGVDEDVGVIRAGVGPGGVSLSGRF